MKTVQNSSKQFKTVKSIFASALSLCFFLSLNSCNRHEKAEVIPTLSKSTLEQIESISSIVKSNPNLASKLKNGFYKPDAFNTRINEKELIEEMPAELQAAIDEFNENPDKVLTDIAQETQGAEKIALLEGLFTQKDAQTLEEMAEVFVPVDLSMEMLDGYRPNASDHQTNARTACSGDCKLHVMAGASIAMGVSAIVYSGASWLSWKIKAVTVVACGVSAGILFGVAKELWDYVRNGNSVTGIHGVEWRDYWNTVIGSFAGGAISFGTISVAPRPVIAVSVIAAGSLFLGRDVIKCCVLKKCPC